MTRKEQFQNIINLLNTLPATEDTDEMVTFLTDEVNKITARTEKAAAKRAEKRAAMEDALLPIVYDALTDEYNTLEGIAAIVRFTPEFKDITRAKVQARVSKLVRDGKAERGSVKGEDSKKRAAYRLPQPAED